MKSWSYTTNPIYKKANIYLEEASWWVFLVDRIAEFACDLVPAISLPRTKIRLKRAEDIEFNGGFVHMLVFDFCQRRIKSKSIEIGYGSAREMFYEEDKEFWGREISDL